MIRAHCDSLLPPLSMGIRVVETRGDSSILSTLTKGSADCQLSISDCSILKGLVSLQLEQPGMQDEEPIGNWHSEIGNVHDASLVQLAQDTALPALRHRFDSGTMLQHCGVR